MNLKRMKALLLTLVMVFSLAMLCACDKGENTTGSSESTTTESTTGKTAYTVTVADVLGNPYNDSIVVVFKQNGEQVAMQPVDANGVATKELEPGDYDVELMFTNGATYHYDMSNMTVSAAAPTLQVEMANVVGTEAAMLYVGGAEHNAPYLNSGCTFVQVSAGERNYFVFTPLQSGTYEFTVHNAQATIGLYGTPFFVYSESTGEVTGEHSFTTTISDSMIGDGTAGTTQLVIGVDAGADTEGCTISISRIAEYVPTPQEMPWTVYEPTHTPTDYTLPEGLVIQEFDLTAAYDLVFNEADGFYHLGSADGPVVLVRLYAPLTYGGSLGDILANINVGVYFYDEDGSFLYKELYNDCLLSYLGTLNKGMGSYNYIGGKIDATYGVYPLNKDLEYIIKTFGESMGWWEKGSSNYLFDTVYGLNVESAWLFMCCYAE